MSEPYEGCTWCCTQHNGANGCFRRKNDPEINDDFCVGLEVCQMEWDGACKCETCALKDKKNIVICVYGGCW